MEFIVQSNVELPPRRSASTGELAGFAAVLRKMEPGQSVHVPVKASKVSSSVASVRKSTGYKFTSRSEDGGVRVWRVE